MSRRQMVQHVLVESEFKWMCDGLLRLEIGPGLQTFACGVNDGGVDAEYVGDFEGVKGRWVFQYKHATPGRDQAKARADVIKKKYFPTSRKVMPEFKKARVKGCCGYILLTNIEVTVGLVHELREAFVAEHGDRPFRVWDPSTLNQLIQKHPQVAGSHSAALGQMCLDEIVGPLWKQVAWVVSLTQEWARSPLWPCKVMTRESRPKLLRSFKKPLADPVCEWVIFPDTAALDAPSSHWLFDYCATTAFAYSFVEWSAFTKAVKELDDACKAWFGAVRAVICAPEMGLFPDLSEGDREQMSWLLAYNTITLEHQRERYWYSGGDKRLEGVVHGAQGVIYEGPYLDEVKGGVERLHGHPLAQEVPANVLRAREQLAEVAAKLASGLWYPALLEMDAPRPLADDDGA